ncbi:MAG: DNA polymerase III subunit gamma/tau [Candidatus Wallbacteria bacterium]|nr:DNA polymerase III subunit gamma/tau [Candidatus Wallbacteria bacterium]
MGAALSLYRKYRPSVFADVAGQESVTRGLLGALRSGGVSHAYLFTGPRGSGKTTTARLLAKAINCRTPMEGEPCNTCELCSMANEGRLLDIVELDAASNRGIDEIRTLREQVNFSPSLGKYKTYILDEVHMLTKDAANAFLKTLEEPPSHVVFVLATTEAHKVLATIASRCQRYDFQRIGQAAASERLTQVLVAEAIDAVAPEAIEEIVRRGDGSLRDMLGLLEQVLSLSGSPGTQSISADDVRRALGLARAEAVERLSGAMRDRDPGRLLAVLAEMHEQGIEPHAILGQLTEHQRDALAKQVAAPGHGAADAGRSIAVLARLSALAPSLKQALDPRLTLEIGLLESAHAELLSGREELLQRIESLSAAVAVLQSRPAGAPGVAPALAQEPAVPAPEPAPPRVAARPSVVPAAPPAVSQPSAPLEAVQAPGPGDPQESLAPLEQATPVDAGSDLWARVIEDLNREKPQTAAFAREGRALPPAGKKLRIVFSKIHTFHRGRLGEADHSALLRKVVKQHYGKDVTVVLEEEAGNADGVAAPTLDKDWADKAVREDKTVKLIQETFAGEIVRTE